MLFSKQHEATHCLEPFSPPPPHLDLKNMFIPFFVELCFTVALQHSALWKVKGERYGCSAVGVGCSINNVISVLFNNAWGIRRWGQQEEQAEFYQNPAFKWLLHMYPSLQQTTCIPSELASVPFLGLMGPWQPCCMTAQIDSPGPLIGF